MRAFPAVGRHLHFLSLGWRCVAVRYRKGACLPRCCKPCCSQWAQCTTSGAGGHLGCSSCSMAKTLVLLATLVSWSAARAAGAGCLFRGQQHAVGERWVTGPPDKCAKYLCEDDGQVAALTCPWFLPAPGCSLVPGAEDAVYPGCCPLRKCHSNQDPTTTTETDDQQQAHSTTTEEVPLETTAESVSGTTLRTNRITTSASGVSSQTTPLTAVMAPSLT